jgi:hypothetical protein
MRLFIAITLLLLSVPVIAQNDSLHTNVFLKESFQPSSAIQDLNLYNFEFKNSIERERLNKVLGYTGFILGEFIRASKLNELNSCSPNLH